jgi:hypothetical protein
MGATGTCPNTTRLYKQDYYRDEDEKPSRHLSVVLVSPSNARISVLCFVGIRFSFFEVHRVHDVIYLLL